jgi:P27 family predicted phage terminase small subunit
VSDLAAIRRLFTLYDERERCLRSARTSRLVDGLQGQPVLNPLYRHMSILDAEIRTLEDRFGFTPAARARFGVSAVEAVDKWARLVSAEDSQDPDDDRSCVGYALVAAAVIDRLVHHATVVSKGDSYRLKDRDLGRVPTDDGS